RRAWPSGLWQGRHRKLRPPVEWPGAAGSPLAAAGSSYTQSWAPYSSTSLFPQRGQDDWGTRAQLVWQDWHVSVIVPPGFGAPRTSSEPQEGQSSPSTSAHLGTAGRCPHTASCP